MNSFTPWVEKYRPNTFEEIVLDPLNKKILENIIKTEGLNSPKICLSVIDF